MKILFLSNNHSYNWSKSPRGWTYLPHLFEEEGHEVKTLTKYDLIHFYKHYKQFQPNVIVTTWIPAGTIPIIYKWFGKIKCPIVHAWDDYYSECMTNYPRWITRFLEKITIKHSDYITTTLVDNYLIAKCKMGKKTYKIDVGVETRKKKCKYKLVGERGKLKVLYLGEQTNYKQVNKLIRQLYNHPNFELYLVGTPNEEYAKWCIANEMKNITFVEAIPSEEVYSLLQQANILVNSGNQDGNFKFFEYIRAGKPIVAWDGRPNNLFINRKNALLTQNFADALFELYMNKKLRVKLARNVKKIRVKSWKEVARQYLWILEGICHH